MSHALPEEILRKAYCTSQSGKLAWHKEDALEAVKILPQQNLAVLGGDLWAVSPSGRIQHFTAYHWDAQPHTWLHAIETWQEFCARTADYTLGVLSEWDLEQEFSPEDAARLLFHLEMVDQSAYEKQVTTQKT
jgi:hypothetical protein